MQFVQLNEVNLWILQVESAEKCMICVDNNDNLLFITFADCRLQLLYTDTKNYH